MRSPEPGAAVGAHGGPLAAAARVGGRLLQAAADAADSEAAEDGLAVSYAVGITFGALSAAVIACTLGLCCCMWLHSRREAAHEGTGEEEETAARSCRPCRLCRARSAKGHVHGGSQPTSPTSAADERGSTSTSGGSSPRPATPELARSLAGASGGAAKEGEPAPRPLEVVVVVAPRRVDVAARTSPPPAPLGAPAAQQQQRRLESEAGALQQPQQSLLPAFISTSADEPDALARLVPWPKPPPVRLPDDEQSGAAEPHAAQPARPAAVSLLRRGAAPDSTTATRRASQAHEGAPGDRCG